MFNGEKRRSDNETSAGENDNSNQTSEKMGVNSIIFVAAVVVSKLIALTVYRQLQHTKENLYFFLSFVLPFDAKESQFKCPLP